MVKGTNRHVIVVRSPDPKVFEEAIFVLREEYLRERSAEEVLEEAQTAAAEYLRKNGGQQPRRSGRLRWLLLGLCGLLSGGIGWLVWQLVWAG